MRKFFLLSLIFCCGCVSAKTIYQVPKILAVYPHDTKAFTQGLDFDGTYLYESIGLYGQSALRKEILDTGKIVQEYKLPRTFFAEGITLSHEEIVQLTYQEKTAFVYNKNNFERIKQFSYAGQGWGLAQTDQAFVMSNGSAELTFLNKTTFEPIKKMTVTLEGKPLRNLNALSIVGSTLYANIWLSPFIAEISLADGKVIKMINCSQLYPKNNTNPEAVLNGIAYLPSKKALIVTGKLWPHTYLVGVS